MVGIGQPGAAPRGDEKAVGARDARARVAECVREAQALEDAVGGRDVAPQAVGIQMTCSLRSDSICVPSRPRTACSTLTVCSPSNGGARSWAMGVAENLIGFATMATS